MMDGPMTTGNLQSTPNISQAITDLFGERCSTFDAACRTCIAWMERDLLTAEIASLRATNMALVAGQAKAYQQGLDDAAKALPSMVAPLVWVKRRNCQIWESNNYFVAEQVTRLHDKNRGFGMFLNYKKQSSHNTLEGAQNAANAHNADRSVAKAIAAVTVGGA